MPKTLADLLSAVPQTAHVTGDASVPITAPVVEADAEVQPGGVFVARVGQTVDGHKFIPRAVERGAVAIVGERPFTDLPVPYAQVENAQEAVGYLAAAYHDFPSRKLTVIGVTGTDGKTTTCTLIHSIFNQLSGGAGLISTIKADVGSQILDTGLHVTTPGAPMIQSLLAQMVANGLQYAVLEVTSHGLAQGRVNGIDLDVAVLTNITHEHLNEHKTFENYRAAKGRLFEILGHSLQKTGRRPFYKLAVINRDDPNADYFIEVVKNAVLAGGNVGGSTTFGLHSGAWKPVDVRYEPNGTHIFMPSMLPDTTEIDDPPTEFFTPLVGEFNAMNVLAAITVTSGIFSRNAIGIIRKGLEAVQVIPGRMERIDEGQNFLALVDFAHTPNALENVLNACRKMVPDGKRLIAIIGSAGLRDLDKRRLMPAVAARLADFTILTAEDPRTESFDDILATMAQAATEAGGIEGATFVRIPDRGEALYRACQMAQAGDLVITCGKGHEQSMAFGKTEYPWDDRDALRAALRGTPLKTLPTARP